MEKKRIPKKRKKRTQFKKNIFYVIIFLIIVLGTVISIKKYSPTKEHMDLSEYFVLDREEAAAVIINSEYDPKEQPEIPNAIVADDVPLLELDFLKTKLDKRYVYDRDEKILRYVTVSDVISAKPGELFYTKGKERVDFPRDIIIEKEYGVYISIDFIKEFTDISYIYNASPNRVSVDTAGRKKVVSEISKDTALRRFGGSKSKIIKDATKGEKVEVIEDYGRWSKVLTEDNVIGCIKNKFIKNRDEVKVENNLPKREYNHNLLDRKVNMAWHQVGGVGGNATLEKVLANTSGINVISPTWYRIADNAGNISSISSLDYVNTCHSKGIQVWGLVSNFENEGVDSTIVLNRTSSRDNLVNSIISAAIRDNLDGINIDFEALSNKAADGYLEFIRELSLKCRSNDIVLSVDNYKVENFNAFYDRKEQSLFADYVIVMAYDEFHGDSESPGSNSSLPFVKEAVAGTLEEVPAEQLILALPFYTRIWTKNGDTLSNRSIGMNGASELAQKYNTEKIWKSEEEQYYIKYEDDKGTNEVWLEDEESLSRKLDVAKEDNLAGVAFWKLGFEPSSIWGIVSNYVN